MGLPVYRLEQRERERNSVAVRLGEFAKKANARVDKEVMHVSASAHALQASAQSLANLQQAHGKGGGGHHARISSNIPKNPNPAAEAESEALATKGFVSVFTSPSTSQTDSTPSSTEGDSFNSQEGSASAPATEDAASPGPEDSNAASILTAQTYTDKGTLIGVPKAGSIFSATV